MNSPRPRYVAILALAVLPTAIDAFCGPSSSPRAAATARHRRHLASSSTPTTDPDGGSAAADDGDAVLVDATTMPAAASGNPFLSLLSKGMHRTSIAMDGSTSDRVFKATPSLQRLRKQVRQLTEIGPSSLGDHAGLGLFATKNIKAGTVVGLYPAHALGYELVVPIDEDGDMTDESNLQDLSMFLAGNDEDEAYFATHPHGNSPYLHATDQPLFQRPSLLSSLFNEGKDEMSPPLYLDVNPSRNDELDGTWTSHYINDGASLLDLKRSGASMEEAMEQYYVQSTRTKNCIHIPFGPSPILATVTTKKVKKGQELFTSYGVVYWLGAIPEEEEEEGEATPSMTEKVQEQILQTARDLQKAMEEARRGYEAEMADLETALDGLD